MIHFVQAFHLPNGHFNKLWNIPLKKKHLTHFIIL